jgi:hypothetical protein
VNNKGANYRNPPLQNPFSSLKFLRMTIVIILLNWGLALGIPHLINMLIIYFQFTIVKSDSKIFNNEFVF